MKLKKRMVVCMVTSAVMVTMVVVLDIQTRLSPGLSHTPAQASLRYAFHQRHLQRTNNGSREASLASNQLSAGGEDPGHHTPAAPPGEGAANRRQETSPPPRQPPDPYDDLHHLVTKLGHQVGKSRHHHTHWNPTLGELLGRDPREKNATLWDDFHLSISQDELYGAEDPTVNRLLKYMTTLAVSHVSQTEGGTQIKLTVEFVDGGRALFKPMRYPREQQTLKNQFYFTDFERHNAEIAAFHLDRLLGFRRAVPTVGRSINISREVFPLAHHHLRSTFFFSPEHNHCFHGKCSYYCDTAHAICGDPDMLEGSFAIFLPEDSEVPRTRWRHPWRRSYSRRRRAQWETDAEYCGLVRTVHPYNEGRRLLDLIDMAVLDFLMGNMDRHHYETFKMLGNNSAPVHLDHGRGFGKAFHDEVSILAPLYQCCLLRHSTLATLLRYHRGPERLSDALRASLDTDPLAPVLWEPHLAALDRRLATVLRKARKCVAKAKNPNLVILDDSH